jgi:hypothetical protein
MESVEITTAEIQGRSPQTEHSLRLAEILNFSNSSLMTASAVIEEIKHLPRAEQTRVIQFALELARQRQSSGDSSLLSPEELGELARRMVETGDPVEAGRIQEEIVRGFYGRSHA